MSKVYVVSRGGDQDRLLNALRELGAVHLAPMDPARAVAEEQTLEAMDSLRRAMQVLAGIEAAGRAPDLSPVKAAEETLQIQRQSAERTNRLASLHRQLAQFADWGDARLEQFAILREAGINIRFFVIPNAELAKIRAECVQVIAERPGRRLLVAVIDRRGQFQPPEAAEPVELPARDRPSIRAEAAEIDAALRKDAQRLSQLAHLSEAMDRELRRLRRKADYTIALRGGLAAEDLFALQGWVPAEEAGALNDRLAKAGVHAAVREAPPAENEQPPTLIRYPRWTRPMKGLFKLLGTVPGYGEFDVSPAFMIALPIFAAILISDTGYGLIYLLLPALFFRRMAAKVGPELRNLVMVIGAASVIWGLLTAGFFGYDISPLLSAVPGIGPLYDGGPIIVVGMAKISMDRLMWISFIIGGIHLSLAHLWRAKANFPHPRFLGNLGWAAFLWGMFGVVTMFVVKGPFGWHTPYPYLLIFGGAFAVIFCDPQRNMLKAVGLGLANFPLSAMSTFGDTVSYVRLMAIGLTSTVLAIAFNKMGGSLPIYGRIPVMMAGHALNVALTIVALFAHGVRLNMLEFSSNLGMTWSGYSYEPFSNVCVEET
jgi:V/A-type H+-transporting ATPase subunit I